jgi:K+-sensing histidine kinase KdpD
MRLGYELVKEQLFFRKELTERVYWFIRLRWAAVGGGLSASWAAFFLNPEFPILPVTIVLLLILAYNSLFLYLGSRLEAKAKQEISPYNLFAHVQISADLLVLYIIIYFTGGFYSPIIVFVLFHIILAGILLSPLSCYIYSFIVVLVSGGMIILQQTSLMPRHPGLFQSRLVLSEPEIVDVLILYLVFTALILISAFLTTSLKRSLRTKGRELLAVSRELEISNTKLTALYEMVKEMAVRLDLNELMDLATMNAARIMGVKGCSIKLLDEQRKTLKFASTYGLSENYVSKGMIDVNKSPINKRIVQGSFLAISNINEEDFFQYPEDVRKEGIASMVCLPLRVEKMVIGVFCVYSDVSHYFDDEDIKFFHLISDLTALAIENLRMGLSKTWFLQKAAHQLRSPLNAIHSMLKTLEEGYLGELNQEQKNTVIRSERRLELLGKVVNDLLELDSKRGHMTQIEIHPVDAAGILEALADLYRAQALDKGIDFVLHIDQPLPEVLAEEKLLDDLFGNLLSNALKYTPAGGKVNVSLAKDTDHRVRFTISDTGIGIEEEEIPQLFTELYRTETAKNFNEEGTGLGLVIVKEIVNRLRGSISVESKPGQGTTFISHLPSV